MKILIAVALTCLWAAWPAPAQSESSLTEHELTIRLNPEDHRLWASDQITLPGSSARHVVFSLHRDLEPRVLDPGIKISELPSDQDSIRAQFELDLPAGTHQFTIEYSGQIYHPLEAYGKEQARGFRDTPGLISAEGVYLAGSSYWYPQIVGQTRLKFSLNTVLPDSWQAVSQGTRTEADENSGNTTSSWHSPSPQEQIYLVAAPFVEYSRQAGNVIAQVFLLEKDEKLADSYLDATTLYLKMYETLLGPYPYSKFALVENFWETGFGMPSFTLLGSKVIRLPFIVNSSYPHEILHNWWGNGVYVDYASGNWSEGLTAYLADHLIKEQQAQGAAYRQQSLQKYRDYAASNRDFPLSDFTGRYSSASEAVGYGKTLMLMHMLRQSLGDEKFILALQQFYQQHLFGRAAFDDLRIAFEKTSGEPLADFFKQWVGRTGAPELSLLDSEVEQCGDEYCLHFSLQQMQEGAVYQLEIPIAVTLAGVAQAHQSMVSMQQKKHNFEVRLPARPSRIDIDPEFDLFRKLAQAEIPPAFTQLFGSPQMLVVLPSKANGEMKAAWQLFADDLTRMGPDQVEIVLDSELATLPENMAVAVLGRENKFSAAITSNLSEYGASVQTDHVSIDNQRIPHASHSIALTIRSNGSPRALVATDLASALPGLGRKLPHYHKYSYLAFSGDEPEIQHKGRWPVTLSPMTALFSENAQRGTLAKRSALISPPVVFDSKRMMNTIETLVDDELQGRGFEQPGLAQAADMIAEAFQKAGLEPGGDKPGSYFQVWQDSGGEPAQEIQLRNVIGIIRGNDNSATESVVVGAHYDHLGMGWPNVRADNQGQIHPGADDNASGVAVMLELAQTLVNSAKPDRDIIFVAFSAEEAGRLGSRHYVDSLLGKRPFAMLNLDTVGRLGDNDLLVLGAESASEWPHVFRGISYISGIPITMVKEPLDASDQISFHEAGIPAVQLFSGANLDYHQPSDTADKIDSQGLVKVATVAREVIEFLASRKEPMTINLDSAEPTNGSAIKTSRKVSLGSIPDFTFQGNGYRLDGVVPNSPAAIAGLKKGDVIVKIDQSPITGLRAFSDLLKRSQPNQILSINFLRQGTQNTTHATLTSN